METPKSHPHAKLIKAWADGAKIQSRYLIDFDNVEQWSKWTDDDEPNWCDEDYQFRINPEEDKTWKPKKYDTYCYLFLDRNGEICICKHIWKNDYVDNALYRNHNVFPTKEDAEDAIPRVIPAQNSDSVNNINIPTNVDSPEIDGKLLTDGEKAMIRALRNVKITRVPDFATTTLCYSNSDGTRCQGTNMAVAFFTCFDDDQQAVIDALKQIKREQEEKECARKNTN